MDTPPLNQQEVERLKDKLREVEEVLIAWCDERYDDHNVPYPWEIHCMKNAISHFMNGELDKFLSDHPLNQEKPRCASCLQELSPATVASPSTMSTVSGTSAATRRSPGRARRPRPRTGTTSVTTTSEESSPV